MNVREKRRQYPKYVSMDRQTDLDYGDPYEVFGINSLFEHYERDKQIYTIDPETLVGKLHVADDELPLTAPLKRRALRLIQRDNNDLETGRVLYIIYPEIYPYSLLNIEGTPFEEITPDWPPDIEFIAGTLESEIMRSEAKTLAVNVEDVWKERGGHPEYRQLKSEQGGWTSQSERSRVPPARKI